ncbi:MAG TPA: hypothetical protein V6C65_26890 [Allocoleopsis sp.]
MANKNPSPKTRFQSEGLAEKPVCVRLPVEVDVIVRSIEDKNSWLRRVICEAVEREFESSEQ